MFYIYIYFF